MTSIVVWLLMLEQVIGRKCATLSGAVPTSFDILLASVFVATTLDGVTSFFLSQQRKKCMLTAALVNTVGGISLCDDEKLEESEGYNYFFVIFYVLELNRSALVRDLLSNKSQFVDQLKEDKSLALHARDLIFFTTDLQSVIYY